jgi:uncharacterized SAM-binding protein YcdF (DUF218 family)
MNDPTRTAADLSAVAAFLAAPDFSELSPSAMTDEIGETRADLLILLGNSVLHTVASVAAGMKGGVADRLLIAGGEGHSTVYLRETIRAFWPYQDIAVDDRSEAEILRDVLVRAHGLDEQSILIETESTNCGANAECTHRLLEARGLAPKHVILVQDPTMQRRTWASFRRAWGEDSPIRFFNCPTFVPQVQSEDGSLVFESPDRPGLWSMERFVSLVMGEIPRLRNDESGYGPRGHDYIVAVDIPPEIEAAYQRLLDVFEDYVRPPA